MRPHLASLIDDFRQHSDEIAIVSHRGNRRFPSTYGQLAELSARCARFFDEHGLHPGDRVLLWGNNSVEWAATFFGCILRGLVAVPLDVTGNLTFAQRVMQEVQPRVVAGNLPLLRGLMEGRPSLPMLGFNTFTAQLPQPDGALDYAAIPGLSRDTPLQIIFTSGTTAEPKGIVHTHGNVLASLDPLEEEIGKYLRYERIVHPLRILHTLPLSHVFGQFMGLWVSSLLTAEVHYEERLHAPRLARLLKQERISVLAGVPRVLDLMRTWLVGEFPGLGQELVAAKGQSISKRWWRFRNVHRRLGLKFWAFVSGGATLPADLEAFWTTLGFALVQGYGMTETTALVTLNHPFKTAKGSIGKPLAGREVKIGEDGEIMVRGASIAAQRWRNGALAPVEEDWLATGDLASRNEKGDLVFAGRKSDVIVTSAGLNIHPEDLEEVLRRQARLRASVVVRYDSPAGPAPAAVLIPSVDNAGDELLASVMDQVNQDLAPFQQIRSWVRWPQPEFPTTSTGKVLRREVQAWAAEALAPRGNAKAALPTPQDPLLGILLQLGAGKPDIGPGDRLRNDLQLDSLAMVQLQSMLESKFGTELSDAALEQAQTVGDLRQLLRLGTGSVTGTATLIPNNSGVPAASAPAQPLDQPALPAPPKPPPTDRSVFPRWPAWVPVRGVRDLFLEGVMRPLVWLLQAPRKPAPVLLQRPSLLIANHLTAMDVPVILYALSGPDRRHTAVAMSGQLLTGWRHARAQRHRSVALLTPLAYWLVTAFFNVFPLPRGAGLRESFAHAGWWLDRDHHVLLFPEGRRSRDGQPQRFEPGIGLLAQESQVPVQPIWISGLRRQENDAWPTRGTVSIRLGQPLTMNPGEEPQAFTRRLEAALRALADARD